MICFPLATIALFPLRALCVLLFIFPPSVEEQGPREGESQTRSGSG